MRRKDPDTSRVLLARLVGRPLAAPVPLPRDGHRPCLGPPRRAARPGGPGGAGRDFAHQRRGVRRRDRREVTLADLCSAERVQAEEVGLSVPDGRSVRTLLDATPIRSADGAVATVVVTIQDLAPLEALERSRAEFLGLVSHELRAPLASLPVIFISPPTGAATPLCGARGRGTRLRRQAVLAS